MKKILGIDLGTNSLGWALIEQEAQIIDGGVIIFPRGNNEDPKTGKESSFSQQRTTFRGARRRLFRRKLRRKKLLAIAKDYFNLNPEDIYTDTDPLHLYQLRKEGLDRLLTEKELFRVCLYFAKKRGFLSNRKNEARANDDSGVVKKAISELGAIITQKGYRTLGEYYYFLASEHREGRLLEERILQRYTSRAMYQHELSQILENQIKLNSKFLTKDLAEKITKEIFFQRPLKSAKHLVGKCRYETSKRCMPRSHPLFQEFRAWQIINNLRWINHDTAETDLLNPEQREKAFEYFNSDTKLTESKLKKHIGLSARVKFTDIELKPTKTIIEIKQALGSTINNLSHEDILNLYHSLLFTQDQNFKKFKNYISTKWHINEATAALLWDIKLEPDYSNISHKAAAKILPFMKAGMRYDRACVEAGYHHSLKTEFKNLDKVPNLKTNEMRNPVVQKAIATTISLVNKIIDAYGKPDEVRIELARELKKPKTEREKIRSRNKSTQEKRDLYRDVLEKHFGKTVAYSDSVLKKYELWLELGCADNGLSDFEDFARSTKKVDLEKYNLWLEANRVSPYTGNIISLSSLMSAEIEIEHILPFSRSLDNSFMNKTLCEKSFNVNLKKKMTPLEYFDTRPEKEKNDFLKRIALFSNSAKRNIFLAEALPDSFANNQLSDTAYIAIKAIEKISLAIENVKSTKGGVTSIIRKELGLNSILHYHDDPNISTEMKNRGDHRHHFIDAVVIATTTQKMLQQISHANTLNGKITLDLEAPWSGFRTSVEEKANQILIVHKQKSKLVRKSINKYRHSTSKDKKIQEIRAIRGSMHEDSLYGKILNPCTKEENYVIRKNVKSLDEKQIHKIIDVKIREFLLDEIKVKGSWNNVLKSEILFNGKPLRSVRWQNNASSLKLLRGDTKTFIETGNNYLLALYEGEDGKRTYDSITFYDAVNLKLNNHQVYHSIKDDKKLLYTIMPLDKFIIYNESPDEIDWNDTEFIANNLYHLIKFTSNKLYFGNSKFSKISADADKMPLKYYSTSNTIKAIKIKIDILGRVIWRSDIGQVIK